MSKLTDTKQAYDKVASLLRKEFLQAGSNANEVKRVQEAVDVAFYLLGWAQFEHLIREETIVRIEEHALAKTVHGIAWQYIKEHVKSLPVRRRLDLIFHANQKVRNALHDDYDLRNGVAHNYKVLPKEARDDMSEWLRGLEELVEKSGSKNG
jgi:hypothetical protein